MSSDLCSKPFSFGEWVLIILPSVITISKFIVQQWSPSQTPSILPSPVRYIFLGLAVYVLLYSTIQYYKYTPTPQQKQNPRYFYYCLYCKHKTPWQTLKGLLFLLFSLTISFYNVYYTRAPLLLWLNIMSAIVSWNLFLRGLYV